MKRQRLIDKLVQIKSSTFSREVDGGVVFLLLLFCPYIISMFFTQNEQYYQGKTDDNVKEAYVSAERGIGTIQIPLEEYIKGILPAVLPMEYEMTSFQVQSVLLRSLYQKGELGEYIYLSGKERKEYFGEQAEEYEAKLEEAVKSTRGLYLAFLGEPIDAAFCRVSAGSTRSGKEVLGEEYSYLKSVSCLEDYHCEDYQQTMEMEKEEFYKLLKLENSMQSEELPEIITDSSGYVLWVVGSKEKNGKIVKEYYNGEKCASDLGLSSSHFAWKIKEGKIQITCKGVGHGFGCSQYSVNELAKEGKNFEEILHHFFTDITIEKIE